jgi:hypothetical protein
LPSFQTSSTSNAPSRIASMRGPIRSRSRTARARGRSQSGSLSRSHSRPSVPPSRAAASPRRHAAATGRWR